MIKDNEIEAVTHKREANLANEVAKSLNSPVIAIGFVICAQD